MAKPEDDLPPFYIEAAQAVVHMHPFPTEAATGEAIDAVCRAILSAVEGEREACATEAARWNDGIDAAEHIRRRNRKGA